MPTIEGPYLILPLGGGLVVPCYVMPFDKRGRCKAPRTREHLLRALREGGYTHVFLFSHGWNNDWQAATERYEGFIRGFAELRGTQAIEEPLGYRPLLVGVFWPSTSLVLPWERGPRFAAVPDGEARDGFADDLDRSLDAFADDLAEEDVARFYELAGADALGEDGLRQLASLLVPQLGADDELGVEVESAEELAEAWLVGARALVEDEGDDGDEFGTAAPVTGGAGPQAAGLLSKLDPRVALRMATVWKMKDRAGTVGANGVRDLLQDVLATSAAAVHLVGHSYGAKVLMSAVAIDALPRPVASALLVQPAISHRAFAVDADGAGRPGGYRVALAGIAQPILTTFSNWDFALHEVFHLAVRRKSDLGEQRIAARPPSRFAALGGYGPGGMRRGEDLTIEIRDPGEPYVELERAGLEVLALDGSRRIKGHGDILQPATYWALHEQVRYGQSRP
jgi:hypothetical protein